MAGRPSQRLWTRYVLTVPIAIVLGQGIALAAIDLNGKWDVTITTPGGPFPQSWFIAQSGSALSQIGPYTGTIDTGTGAMSFGGLAFGAGCTGGGPDSWTGTAAGDSNSFTASGTMYLPVNMDPPFFCASFAVSLTATRNPCGNGVVDPGEGCDDGDLIGSDCCSYNCNVQPDAHGCDDGNPTTPSVCLSGVCTTLPATPEFQVNSYTTGRQLYHDIACDADGDFVVAWRRTSTPLPQGGSTTGTGVYAQRYNSTGAAIGSEFFVTSDVFGQHPPAVGMNADGDLVIAWKLANEIRARRYDSSNAPIGTEFVVTSDTAYVFSSPDIDVAAAGDFIVGWSQISPGPFAKPFARRFDSTGTPVAPALMIDESTSAGVGTQVATDDTGRFVAVWSRHPTIVGRRFDSSGTPVGTEFQVSPYPGFQGIGDVAAGPTGHFVVTWSSGPEDGSGQGVFAQRYASTGAAVGTAFQVNTYTTDYQTGAKVALDASGSFVIVWDSFLQDGSGTGVYGQRFDRLGNPLGSEFAANGFTYNDQLLARVCAESDGDFVMAWMSGEQDGSDIGVFARQFDVPPPPQLLDHYKCYQGTDLRMPPFAQVSVDTTDQLGSETVDVRKLKFVCVPVDKNGEGINDLGAHLSCYQVTGDRLEPRPVVELSTQFQSSRFEVKKPHLICLPSTKTLLP